MMSRPHLGERSHELPPRLGTQVARQRDGGLSAGVDVLQVRHVARMHGAAAAAPTVRWRARLPLVALDRRLRLPQHVVRAGRAAVRAVVRQRQWYWAEGGSAVRAVY